MENFMKKKINLLIIGAGKIAEKHLELLKDQFDLSSSYIFSRRHNSSRRLSKKFYLNHLERSLLSFIEKNKFQLNGIFILTSADQIYKITKKIISFKIPLFIEKPPGLNYNELIKLISLSKKYKTSNLVGYNRRYYSIVQQVKKKLKKEKIVSVNLEINERMWILKKKVQNKKILSKWIYANTSHAINLLIFLLGNPKLVKNITAKNKTNSVFKMNNSYSLLKFNSNILVSLNILWNAPGGWLLKIFCKDNTYTFNPLEKCEIINRKFQKKIVEPRKYDEIYKPGFYLQSKKFIEIIKSKKYYNDLAQIRSTFLLINKILKK